MLQQRSAALEVPAPHLALALAPQRDLILAHGVVDAIAVQPGEAALLQAWIIRRNGGAHTGQAA